MSSLETTTTFDVTIKLSFTNSMTPEMAKMALARILLEGSAITLNGQTFKPLLNDFVVSNIKQSC